MADSKLNDMIAASLENIKMIADADTIVGTPINTAGGTVILPISKVSLGFASGGADYYPKKKDEKGASAPAGDPCFGGGGGTGVTVTPICFLIVKADGSVDILNINAAANSSPVVSVVDTVSSLIESSPDLISRFKNAFAKKKNIDDLDDEKLKSEIASDSEKEKK